MEELISNQCRKCAEHIGIPGLSVGFLDDLPSGSSAIRERCAALFARSFLEREHMTSVLFARRPEETRRAMGEVASATVGDAEAQGLTALAVDRDGEVVGLLIAEPYSGELAEMPPPLAPVQAVLNRLTTMFNEHLGGRQERPRLVHVAIVAVDSRWGGRGITASLLQLMTFKASLLGYTEAVVEATSHSQFLFARLGFRELGSVGYGEIEELAGILDLPADAPHSRVTHAKLMWAPLPEIARVF